MHEALADFAQAVSDTPELRTVLRNPQLESKAKAGILADLAGDEDVLFRNFLQVVAEKGRAGEIEDIAKEFDRLVAREERRLTVELITARELTDAEEILAEARKTRESMEQRMREETETERQRRLEETRKEIAAETARALEQIRAEVADLTLEAASRVVGKTLDAERDRELIEEAIAGLDFSRLEESA